MQLVKLQDLYDAFAAGGIQVIAVAQEDESLEKHAKMLAHFETPPAFEIVADLDRADTGRYGRATTYLIDADGVVRQVFPNTIHDRAHWDVVLAECRRVLADRADGSAGRGG